jgi:lantibiotic modifying enzyme
MLLGEEELLRQAVQLLVRTRREKPEQYEFDLIYGNAGAIVALLVLRDILGDTSLLDFAVQLGDELLHTANRSERGCSWRSLAFPAQHNLTGLSHGAAGAAYALLELFHETGNTTYRSVAEAAFDYERHWFDADAANWPDFREDPFAGKQRKSRRSFPFATFWCHGAPGIALSRLRAYTILHEERYKAEALIALQTTQKSIETVLYTGMDNFSLCHGLAGNADILLEGRRVLGQEWSSAALLAEKVATFGIDTYVMPDRQWPCGIE